MAKQKIGQRPGFAVQCPRKLKRQRLLMRAFTWSSGFAVRFAALVALLFSITGTFADGNEFFENKIRPIFVGHCYKCHSHDAEKIKGGFVLDSRSGLLKGGDSGP